MAKVNFQWLGLIVLPAVLLTSSVFAAEPSRPQELTAAVVASFPPFYQLNENGQPAGFAIESMAEVAILSGVHVNYLVFDTWTEVLDAVRVGKAQLIPNLGITEDRKKEFLFTRSVITFPISIITRSDTTDINGLSDLVGRRIGTIEKNAAIALLEGRGDITQMVYESFPSALFELLAGNLDADHERRRPGLPATRPQQPLAFAGAPGGAQHQEHGDFGGRVAQHIRRIGDDDAFLPAPAGCSNLVHKLQVIAGDFLPNHRAAELVGCGTHGLPLRLV